MADKSVTYNGAYIIQSGMLVSNYVGSEQDNVKFQTGLTQDGSSKGTFTNTHQPMESNDVEWKKVEVNWTRSTSSGYNQLTENQSDCCSDGTTIGFSKVMGTETHTAYTGDSYIGSNNCLQIKTAGGVVNEGVTLSPYVPVKIGDKVSIKVAVKGSGSVYIALNEFDDSGAWIKNNNYTTTPIALTSTWTSYDLTATVTSGTQVSITVATYSTAQAVTFYVDGCQINLGNPQAWTVGPNDFANKVSLYGIMHNGEPELIGEYSTSQIPPTISSTTESIIFDLKGGAGEPPISKAPEIMGTGKIKLNLPMKAENYESIKLKHAPYDEGWTKCKIIPITGSPDYSYYSYVLGPYTVWYDSDMKTDFSDLRFAIWDGSKMADIPYYIFNYVTGTSAKVFLYIPYLLNGPNITNIYMFYGNPNATTTSASNIYLFDDFEDGQYNGGRPSPYVNYTIGSGTTSIVGSGQQISGNYSIQHHGVDNYTIGPAFWLNCDAFMVDFDFKLSVQGTGTYDPWVTLFYLQYTDANNYLRVDSYWSGTNQRVRLQKRVSGTATTVNEWSWYTHKMPVGETHHYKIIAYLPSSGTQYVSVYIDVTKIINAVNPATTLTNNCWRGFSGGAGATGIWDNIRVRPYVGHIVFDAWNEPTFGAITDEGTAVSPDSWDNEADNVIFTLPSDYISKCIGCFEIVEADGSPYESEDIVITPTNAYTLGYDHTSKYHALRVVVETNAGTTENITFNYIKYNYSF